MSTDGEPERRRTYNGFGFYRYRHRRGAPFLVMFCIFSTYVVVFSEGVLEHHSAVMFLDCRLRHSFSEPLPKPPGELANDARLKYGMYGKKKKKCEEGPHHLFSS